MLRLHQEDGHVTHTMLSRYLDSQIGDRKPYESNREFARVAGVSEGTVRRWRHGDLPSLRALRILSDKMKVPIEQLIGGNEEYQAADAALKKRSPELYQLLEHFLNVASDEQILMVLDILKAVLKRLLEDT